LGYHPSCNIFAYSILNCLSFNINTTQSHIGKERKYKPYVQYAISTARRNNTTANRYLEGEVKERRRAERK